MIILYIANTIGNFFKRNGAFYFGGYPLHFAVCTNDTAMFDLVLSYASTNSNTVNDDEKKNLTPVQLIELKSNLSLLGPNAIFARDVRGNTVLHLCVYHNLVNEQPMYKHVLETAEKLIRKDLINKFLENKEKMQNNKMKKNNDETNDNSDSNIITLNELNYVGEHPQPKHKTVIIKLTEKDDIIDNTEWINRECKNILYDRLLYALNEDYLSPLTLAAIGKGKKGSIEEEELKKKTLEYLISERKVKAWKFGPLTFTIVELEGLDIPFNPNRYDNPEKVKKHSQTVIDIICSLDSEQCIAIDEIKKIIHTKWKLYAPIFINKALIHILILILFTMIMCLNTHTPSTIWTNSGVGMTTILYPIITSILLYLFSLELPLIYAEGFDYFGYYGGIRSSARFDRIARFIISISFMALCLTKGIYAATDNFNRYSVNSLDDVTPIYNLQDFLGVRFTATICIIAIYSYTYYFLMGFDSTGPFVLTIYRIISKNIPFFLQFYVIILVGFACALSMLSNNGDPTISYGFFHFILVIWSLVQKTVNLSPTYSEPDPSFVPNDIYFLFDITNTLFYTVVVLLMLNLLIAIING